MRAAGIREPFAVPEREVDEIRPPVGRVAGTGRAGFLLSPNSTRAASAALELLADGARVDRIPEGNAEAGAPTGTVFIRDMSRSRIEAFAARTGLRFQAVDRVPEGVVPLRVPRVGLYQSFMANMPEGWTRWVLEEYGIPYETVRNEDIQSGALEALDLPHPTR